MSSPLIELARRRKRLPPPPQVLWRDLQAPRREGARVWLTPLRGEQRPTILSAAEPTQVVWSSLWIARPDDRLVLNVAPSGDESALEYVWLEAGEPPSEEETLPLRKRLSRLFFLELRVTYGQ